MDIDIKTRQGKSSEATGVTLRITNLRDAWTQNQLESLILELRRLVSPNEARERGFKIYLDLKGFATESHGFDGQSLVSGAFAEGADTAGTGADSTEIRPLFLGNVYHYRVEGLFNKEGAFEGKFINKRADNHIIPLMFEAQALGAGEEPCGPFSIALNIYDREPDAIVELFRKMGLSSIGRLDARKMLDENIGVGIYRAGFRIRPYGDAESDWLELERKRVQNGSPKVTVYEADLMAALLNIIDNAIHWLSTSPTKPKELRVAMTHSKKWVRIVLSNNGPLIDPVLAKNLFKPGFTLKPEGSGLGLAIAREAMQASKGRVIFDPQPDETAFLIEMQKT